MSHSGSGQSVSEDSTESQSGSTTKRKTEFGKKHRKAVRILTVIAYIISVSTAAVLLSAYYVFLWNPTKPNTRPTESSTTLAMASVQQPSAFVGLPLNSFATSASQSFVFASNKHQSNQRSHKSALHHHGHDKPHYPQIPTPQSLIMQTLEHNFPSTSTNTKTGAKSEPSTNTNTVTNTTPLTPSKSPSNFIYNNVIIPLPPTNQFKTQPTASPLSDKTPTTSAFPDTAYTFTSTTTFTSPSSTDTNGPSDKLVSDTNENDHDHDLLQPTTDAFEWDTNTLTH